MYISRSKGVFSYVLRHASETHRFSNIFAYPNSLPPRFSLQAPHFLQRKAVSSESDGVLDLADENFTLGDAALKALKEADTAPIRLYDTRQDEEWQNIIKKSNEGIIASTNRIFHERVVLPSCSFQEYYDLLEQETRASPFSLGEKRDERLFKLQIDKEWGRREEWIKELKKIEEQKLAIGMVDKTRGYIALEKVWSGKLKELIEEDIKRVTSKDDFSSDLTLVPYVMYMDPDVLSKMIIRMAVSSTVGPNRSHEPLRVAELAYSIGSRVEQYAQGLYLAEKILQQKSDLNRDSKRRSGTSAADTRLVASDDGHEMIERKKELRFRLRKLAALEKVVAEQLQARPLRGKPTVQSFAEARDVMNWGTDLVTKVGAYLVNLLLRVSYLDEAQNFAPCVPLEIPNYGKKGSEGGGGGGAEGLSAYGAGEGGERDGIDDDGDDDDDESLTAAFDADELAEYEEKKRLQREERQRLAVLSKGVGVAGGSSSSSSSINPSSSSSSELDLTPPPLSHESESGSESESAAAPPPPPQILVPAFNHTTTMLGRRVGVLAPHPHLLEAMADDSLLERGFVEGLPPMLVEPRPWSAPHVGGNLITILPILKAGFSHRLLKILYRAHDGGMLNNLYDGLNAVGSTPWSINAFVVQVMKEAYQGKINSARIPDPSLTLNLPSSPLHPLAGQHRRLGFATSREFGSTQSTYLRMSQHGSGQLLVTTGLLLPLEQQAYRDAVNEVNKKNVQLKTDDLMFRRKLDMAVELSDVNKFFLPCQVDFRGRAYPIHHLICQTGDDVSRGLLRFHAAKPLGPRGTRWIKIHLANLWGNGIDKLSIEGRVSFIEDHLTEVAEAADAPLLEGAAAWWLKAEKPWQFLAACKELTNALRADDPAQYHSSLPIHQDGTCNGLQHYAALGRDVRGAKAVNLLQCDKPADVYTEVATVVKKRVAEESKRNVSEAIKAAPYIDRKLVKQTVMTYVYGVTYVGARMQIENRLREKKFKGNASELTQIAEYLTKHTFSSLGEVFASARTIMDFFGVCARVITGNGNAICWTSPIGFPVHQPYVRQRATSFGRSLLKHSISTFDDKFEAVTVDTYRQCLGLPPNFIHSLDASHMFMTAVSCKERGIDFASVHDSFWVHACHVDELGAIIRDRFVELHSMPWLELFREEAAAQNPEAAHLLPQLPAMGTLDLDEVRKSTFFFS